MKQKLLVEIAEETVCRLQDGLGEDSYGCDLHHELWNTDYYIIGTHASKKWIETHMSAFDAMGTIQHYENDVFGESYTDVTNAENVANMLAYIYGEETLRKSRHLNRLWDKKLDKEDLEIIKKEIEEHYGL